MTAVPMSLPAWLYTDQRFFELEREKVFAQAWHIVGHLNDIPRTGDYLTLDMLGERVVTVRGDDGKVRSFHNVCRHRAGKISGETRGSCGHRLVCPYHAWSYKLDGSFAGAPKWQGFDGIDPKQLGLKPVDHGAGLFACSAVRLLDRDVPAALMLPVLLERLVELLVELASWVVADVEQLNGVLRPRLGCEERCRDGDDCKRLCPAIHNECPFRVRGLQGQSERELKLCAERDLILINACENA